MTRRRRSSLFEDLAEIVSRLPWWLGVVLAGVAYAWFHHLATQAGPAAPRDMKDLGSYITGQFWQTLALILQYIVPVACLLGAGISGYRQVKQRKGLEIPVVRARREPRPAPVRAPAAEAAPNCPLCGSPMERRTAKKGARAGIAFWGCSLFPRCRGTLDK